MWTRDSEQILLEMVSHHLCAAGPAAWGEGLSNAVITRVEMTGAEWQDRLMTYSSAADDTTHSLS